MEIIKGVQTMCRYAMSGPYKDIYACFNCRKSFKQVSRYDLSPVGGCTSLNISARNVPRLWLAWDRISRHLSKKIPSNGLK